MLERYVFHLSHCNAIGDVLAEARGKKEDREIKESFRKFYYEGTKYLDKNRIPKILTTKDIKIKKSSDNISGLQLADNIAHPAKTMYLFEKGLIPRPPGEFGCKLVRLIEDKFYRDFTTDKIEGYGKKLV